MYGLVNNYPTTNFHEINLDYIIKLVRENNGLHLDVSGNQLLLKTLDGTTVSSVTVHYAETAGHADTATSATNATYATTASTASTATNASNAGHALTADTATTAGTAQTATTATTAGTATEAVHATSADTALTANTATRASTADYATTTGNVEHADKAIEYVEISGDTVKFKTYDGTETVITVPYSVKALKDSLGNEIISTYITNVVDDNGTLKFKDAEGNDVVSLVPSVETASNDSYGNLIADMIKTIAVSSNSNYVTITHGTGTVDTLTINYSERAYKDTNDNVIKNTYIKSLEMVEDDNTGHYNLVAYNGDNPSAEIFRLELIAYRAQIADDATHASNADYATNAGTAQTAVTATTALTSNNSYYILKAMAEQNDDHTFNITGCYDANGNEVDFDDIPTSAPLIIAWQTYFISGDPETYYYPLNHIFTPHTGKKTPIMLEYDNVNVMGDSDSSTGYSLTHDHLDIVYSNGSWFTGNKVHEVYEIALTPMTI